MSALSVNCVSPTALPNTRCTTSQITERMTDAGDLLIRLVTFPGDHNDIAGAADAIAFRIATRAIQFDLYRDTALETRRLSPLRSRPDLPNADCRW